MRFTGKSKSEVDRPIFSTKNKLHLARRFRIGLGSRMGTTVQLEGVFLAQQKPETLRGALWVQSGSKGEWI